MNYTTLASLTATVRSRMNLTNVNQITDLEVQNMLIDSCSTFYEMLVSRWRDYYSRRYKFSLAPNQDAYDLPEDFRADVAVYLTFGAAPNQQRVQMRPFTTDEYSSFNYSNLASPQYPIMYAVWGDQIVFTPTPSVAYPNAIEWLYVPQFKPPASPTVPLSRTWPNGWERWVVFDTCVSVALRTQQAQYYAMFTKERELMEAKVMAAAAIRSESPQHMIDVYSSGTPWIGSPGT